jgi:hypothetical protein
MCSSFNNTNFYTLDVRVYLKGDPQNAIVESNLFAWHNIAQSEECREHRAIFLHKTHSAVCLLAMMARKSAEAARFLRCIDPALTQFKIIS